jgi:hypothetical protein
LITGISITKDGRYLISNGNDKLTKWDLVSGSNTLTNFTDSNNKYKKENKFCISNNSRVLFQPNVLIIFKIRGIFK